MRPSSTLAVAAALALTIAATPAGGASGTLYGEAHNNEAAPSPTIRLAEVMLAEVGPPIIPPDEEELGSDGGYYLSKGWEYLNAKNFQKAAELFTIAVNFDEAELEAKLGLSYALRNLDRAGEAAVLLEELVSEDFRIDEVLPDLVGLLVAEEKYKKARRYAGALDAGERREWLRKISAGELGRDLKSAIKAKSVTRLGGILNDNSHEIESCNLPWQFFDAAKIVLESGRIGEGTGAMKGLLKGCALMWDLRIAVLYTIKPFTGPGEMEALVDMEGSTEGAPAEYGSKIAELELILKKEALTKTDPSSPETLAAATRLLQENPGDEGLQVVVAWGLFNNGRYEEAAAAFDKLIAMYPDKRDFHLGKSYALDKLGRRSGKAAGETAAGSAATPADEGALAALAWKLYNEGWHEQALDTFDKLLQIDADNKDYATGRAYTLVKLGRGEEALAVAEKFGLADIKLGVLRARLAKLDAATDEAALLARRILAEKPGDEGALTVLGWGYFNSGRTDEAREVFTGLHDGDPTNPDHALGLAFVLVKLGRTEEALALTEKFPGAASFDQIRSDVILAKANAAYESKDYDSAEEYLGMILKTDPGNASAASLLVWVRFNQGRAEEVLPYFEKEYEAKGDAPSASMLLMAYNRAGRGDDAERFAKTLSESDDKETRKAAASFYNDRGWPILAAGTENCDGECWYNALAARVTLQTTYSHKSGDDGTSLLDVLSVPLTLEVPYNDGRRVTLTLKTESLDSGTSPASPFAGSFYLGGAPVSELITSETVTTPSVILEKEGPSGYSIMLGVTPIGGAVSPTITGRLQYGAGPWIVRLHRQPVRESILSYTGLDDPYSDASWGRVTKNGIEIEANGSPGTDWWASLRGGYDSYGGENVIDNSALHATLATGKAYKLETSELSLGFFLSAMSYDKNSNHYTFGHGGYFSPSLFYVAGPTLRFRTVLCRDFLGDLQMSVNYFHSETDTSSRYPLSNNPAVFSQLFDGDKDSGVGYSAGLDGLKLLTPNLAAGARAKLSKSAEYTEWYAGVTLKYIFGGDGGGVEVLRDFGKWQW